jgi:FkbH-like protein
MLRDLSWLPLKTDWNAHFQAAKQKPFAEATADLLALANSRIDLIGTQKLDKYLQQNADAARDSLSSARPVRLAILSSCTTTHLIPSIRVGAFRRGVWADIYEAPYSMMTQELANPASGLHQFKPDVVLFSLDANYVAGSAGATAQSAIDDMRRLWKMAKEIPGCTVIQQTLLPVLPRVAGSNEHRFFNSPNAILSAVNSALRSAAEEDGVHLLAIDEYSSRAGVAAWHDPTLWLRAKQEIHPGIAHIYGDLLGRLLATLRGKSYKCLVLDLDNTVWGGVIGDDGLDGIVLGQGNAVGEAHVALQRYAKRLAERGIILAVCSKNDEANARLPFERHPDMVLRSGDIACFIANWQDKATNLRTIAKTLNIGLDSLVFADDNPFERNLIRQELPMVAVPELPEDAALYVDAISDGGFFEALTLTSEDLARTQQYQANAERERMKDTTTDLAGYLGSLQMELHWSPFDSVGLSRITQLINKSNQFNLTTRRYTEAEVAAMMDNPGYLTLQLRLTDRFGDNGMIAVIIGRVQPGATLDLDTWLMSCRVLGRQVEEATLNLIVACAQSLDIRHVRGTYLPTAKNGMVKDHYGRLGFQQVSGEVDGNSRWLLEVGEYAPATTFIKTVEGAIDYRRDLQPAN